MKNRYTITEKELPSTVKTLKAFSTILLGQQSKIYTDHKNIMCKNFNTYRVLRWRLILEEYSPDIEYIPGENMVADALSRLPNNGNQKTTHESTYKTENISELYDIDELPEGMFPISSNIIDRYQREDPVLSEKLNSVEYQKGYFCGGRNTIKLVTCKNKIVIPQKLQKYVVKWYGTYLLHPGLDQM